MQVLRFSRLFTPLKSTQVWRGARKKRRKFNHEEGGEDGQKAEVKTEDERVHMDLSDEEPPAKKSGFDIDSWGNIPSPSECLTDDEVWHNCNLLTLCLSFLGC